MSRNDCVNRTHLSRFLRLLLASSFFKRDGAMSFEVNGQLVPVGGGDPIPLIRDTLSIGRRESCDICWNAPNVSSRHCELVFHDGYWYIQDLNSTNGVKVNGSRVQRKVLMPDDEVNIAKKRYTIQYTLPADKRAVQEDVEDDIMGKSLLERAGLERPKHKERERSAKGKSFDSAAAEFLLDDDE